MKAESRRTIHPDAAAVRNSAAYSTGLLQPLRPHGGNPERTQSVALTNELCALLDANVQRKASLIARINSSPTSVSGVSASKAGSRQCQSGLPRVHRTCSGILDREGASRSQVDSRNQVRGLPCPGPSSSDPARSAAGDDAGDRFSAVSFPANWISSLIRPRTSIAPASRRAPRANPPLSNLNAATPALAAALQS
jgi:hypothetical protein